MTDVSGQNHNIAALNYRLHAIWVILAPKTQLGPPSNYTKTSWVVEWKWVVLYWCSATAIQWRRLWCWSEMCYSSREPAC
jgi:hypothetical protein